MEKFGTKNKRNRLNESQCFCVVYSKIFSGNLFLKRTYPFTFPGGMKLGIYFRRILPFISLSADKTSKTSKTNNLYNERTMIFPSVLE